MSSDPPLPNMADAAEMLWVVLANVSGGDWTQQTPEWQEAAARWRDNYFAARSSDAPNTDANCDMGADQSQVVDKAILARRDIHNQIVSRIAELKGHA